jgi:dipeptidyl aminopeptidase/acylaminoacyl peptidase
MRRAVMGVVIPLALLVLVLVRGVVAQDAPDYGEYGLIQAQELDLYAGPARTAAHLAPDGTKLAHISGTTVCLFVLEGSSWAEDRCFELERDLFSGGPEDMRWSPDGRYLTLPTFQTALQFFSDTDILVLDTEDGALLNLTDDGFDGSLLGEIEGHLDLSPRWLDEDTLIFIRYSRDPLATADADFSERLLPPALYTVDVPAEGETAEAALAVELPQTEVPIPAYLLAVDAERARAAYNEDSLPVGEGMSVWQTDLADGNGPARLANAPAQTGILALEYAADGQYVLMLSTDHRSLGSRLNALAVSAETGDAIAIDPRFPVLTEQADAESPAIVGAGWSPTGSALAYLVRDRGNPDASGLYIASAPGQPGQLILPGDFYGTTCCQRMPIVWDQNDLIMIGRGAEPGVLLVQVGS